MEHVTRIEQELDSFSHTLSLYREQLNHWLSQTADQARHVADLQSLMGMERIIRFGSSSTAVSSGDDDFISTVVQCPKGGILEIESKFESVYDIPLGNIQVDVIAMDGEKSTPVTLDENGKGQFEGLPGKFYRVHVQGEVAPSKIDELFDSYKGLTTELEGWLRKEWEGFKPQWSQSTFAAAANGMLAGSWAAVIGVWDSLSLLSDILQDPRKFAERLGSGADELARLAETAPEVMAKVQLLASDEAALCLLLRTASLWLEMLPPSEIAGNSAEVTSQVTVSVLIDILIASALAFTRVGITAAKAYLTLRGIKYGALLAGLAMRFVEATFNILNTFMKYVDQYKAVAARGVAPGLKKGRMQLRWDAKRNTTLKQNEYHDDASKQATNPNGDSATCVPSTCKNGCPVSMVTGEELLTLTDGVLDLSLIHI